MYVHTIKVLCFNDICEKNVCVILLLQWHSCQFLWHSILHTADCMFNAIDE